MKLETIPWSELSPEQKDLAKKGFKRWASLHKSYLVENILSFIFGGISVAGFILIIISVITIYDLYNLGSILLGSGCMLFLILPVFFNAPNNSECMNMANDTDDEIKHWESKYRETETQK